MNSWEYIQLGEVLTFNPKVRIPKGQEVPFVPMDAVLPWSRYVNTSEAREFKGGSKFECGDVLMARITPCLQNGKTSVYRGNPGAPAAGSTEFIVIRGREGISDSMFAYYLFRDEEIREYAIRHMSGSSGRQRVQLDALLQLRVRIPPIGEQRRIASTLGALDDKIESNQRQISTLNDLSQTIFRSWRRETKNVTQTTFGEWSDIFGGATPKTAFDDFWGGGIAWATPTDVTNLPSPFLFSTSRTLTESGLNSCAAPLHPPGTIFMTSRATIGAFAVNQVEAATNQGFIAVRPKEPSHRWFLFEEMRSRVSEFIDNANGSTFLEISRGRFKELPISVPSADDLENLDSRLSRFHSLAAAREQENERLASLRDALLPELLSGRIRTIEIEDIVEEALS